MLRHARHQQMLLHQPGQQLDITRRQWQMLGKLTHANCPQLGMIAALTFGDVVKQSGQIQQCRPLDAGKYLNGMGKLFWILGIGEATQIADHEQRVLIHCINMKQVELHESADFAERRQQSCQQAIARHARKLRINAVGMIQNAPENLQGLGAVKAIIAMALQCLLQQTNGGRTHTLDVLVILQLNKHFHDRQWPLHKNVIVLHFQITVDDLEFIIQCVHRLPGMISKRLPELLQQALVEPLQLRHGAKISLHESLYRGVDAGIGLISEQCCELLLLGKQQALFGTLSQAVIGPAHAPEKIPPVQQLLIFCGMQKLLRQQCFQIGAAKTALTDPGNVLDIPQPARPFLDIGLQPIGGVIKVGMPLVLLGHLRGKKTLRRPVSIQGFLQLLLQCMKTPVITTQEVCFHQTGQGHHVAFTSAQRLPNAAHAV